VRSALHWTARAERAHAKATDLDQHCLGLTSRRVVDAALSHPMEAHRVGRAQDAVGDERRDEVQAEPAAKEPLEARDGIVRLPIRPDRRKLCRKRGAPSA
jgi:hypothetical protein